MVRIEHELQDAISVVDAHLVARFVGGVDVGIVHVLAAGTDDEVTDTASVADRVGILDRIPLVVVVVPSQGEIDAVLVE